MVDTTNLVSYYKIDENAANTTVADAHGSNTGTASTNTANLYTASGKINSAFDLVSANSEYVDISDNADSIYPKTINAWFNIDDNTAEHTVFSLGRDADAEYLVIYIDSSGNLQFRSNNNALAVSEDTGINPSTGTWYMVTMIVNSLTDIDVYVDGTSTNTGITPVTMQPLDKLGIGTLLRATGVWFMDGRIDEVAIFDSALNSTQISDLYNGGSGLAYPFSITQSLTDSISATETFTKSVTYNLNDTVSLDDEVFYPLQCISKLIALNDGTITTARMKTTSDGNSNLLFYLSADGGTNWEEVTDNTAHTFTNTGNELKWKIMGNGTTTIVTKVVIDNY